MHKKKCHIQLHKNKETYQLREGTLHECLDAIREFPKHIVIYKFSTMGTRAKGCKQGRDVFISGNTLSRDYFI